MLCEVGFATAVASAGLGAFIASYILNIHNVHNGNTAMLKMYFHSETSSVPIKVWALISYHFP